MNWQTMKSFSSRMITSFMLIASYISNMPWERWWTQINQSTLIHCVNNTLNVGRTWTFDYISISFFFSLTQSIVSNYALTDNWQSQPARERLRFSSTGIISLTIFSIFTSSLLYSYTSFVAWLCIEMKSTLIPVKF